MFRVSKSIEDTKNIAEEFLNTLPLKEKATIVGLSGDLGAGKTTFTQELAGVLGVKDRVTSPTYVILKIYDTTHVQFKRLIHIDAYRLQNGEDLENLGWMDIARESENLIIIEWPEKVAEILSSDILNLRFETINPTTRTIDISYGKEIKE